MTELVILLAEKLGYEAKLAHRILDHDRIVRIVHHYRQQVERRRMNLHLAVDRAFGDICGQNRAEGRLQRSEPKWG